MSAQQVSSPTHVLELPTRQVPYPDKNVDALYGSTVEIDLNTVNALVALTISFLGGTLTGGTSPAWTLKQTATPYNLAITHITIKADNETVKDFDTVMKLEEEMLDSASLPYASDSSTAPIQSITIGLADYDEKLAEFVQHTSLQAWRVSNLQLYLTIAALTSITSGTPTGTSGSVIRVTEEVIDRGIYPKIPQILAEELQTNFNLAATGDNDYSTLPKTGAIKRMLIFVGGTSAGASGSDSLVDAIKVIRNATDYLFNQQWYNLKSANKKAYGIAPDIGFVMLRFVKHGNIGQALKTNDPDVVKSLDIDFHTASAPSSQNAYVLRTEYKAI